MFNLDAGCLLGSLPADMVYYNSSGFSFTCDLRDNIAAPWPSSSSITSISLCAPGNLFEQPPDKSFHLRANLFERTFPNNFCLHTFRDVVACTTYIGEFGQSWYVFLQILTYSFISFYARTLTVTLLSNPGCRGVGADLFVSILSIFVFGALLF